MRLSIGFRMNPFVYIYKWNMFEHRRQVLKSRDEIRQQIILESLAFIFALPHGDPLYEEFENPTPPPIIAFKQVILKLYRPPRLLIAFIAMPGPLPASLRSRILRLLLLHWAPWAIAEEVHCCPATVYNIQENLFMYNSPFRPQFRSKEAPRKVFKAAENDLIVYLEEQS